MYNYLFTHTHVHLYKYLHTQTHTHTVTYIHTQTRMQTLTHTHTHTHTIVRKTNTLIFVIMMFYTQVCLYKWYKHVERINRNKKKLIYIDIYVYIL